MWPTPTPFPTPNVTPVISLPGLQTALPPDMIGRFAETGVNGWNSVNQYGLMDNVMTIVVIIIILVMATRIVRAFKDI